MKMLIDNSHVGAHAFGAIETMLFVLKQQVINCAEGGRSYIAIL